MCALRNRFREISPCIVLGIQQEVPASMGAYPAGAGGPVARVPHRSVLADQVYDILREGLMSRRFAPGEHLNLDHLARELHVSNTPVRQALARLESEGLVTKEPYRGFAASPLLDSRTIGELYGYRMLLEPPTAARTAQRHTAEGLAILERLCDAAEVSALMNDASGEDALGIRDTQFHTTIAREAGNTVVVENLVVALTRMSIYTMYHRHGAAEQAWAEHRVILAAIRASDPDAASAAMYAHLKGGIERIRDAVS